MLFCPPQGLCGNDGLMQSRTSKHDDGGLDPFFFLDEFGLQQFESDANRTKLVSLKEFCILDGRDIGRRRVVIL